MSLCAFVSATRAWPRGQHPNGGGRGWEEKGKRKRKQASILNNFQQVFLHHVQLSVTLSPADHGGSEDPPVSSVSWTSVVTGHAVLGVAFLFLKKASLIADL